MKHHLLSAIFCLASTNALAEKFHFGIRTLLGVSDVSVMQIKDDRYHFDEVVSKNGAASFGLFAEVPLFKYASVQAEALTTTSGFSYSFHDFGQQYHTYRLNRLVFPVLAKARIKGFALYGGAQYGVLQKALLINDYATTTRQTITDDHHKKEWALIYGAEYTAPFGLGFTVRYQYGLTNIAVNGSHTYPISDRVTNNVLSAGLYFRFLK